MQNHLAAIGLRTLAPEKLPSFEAIHQFNDAVMAQLHPLGYLADTGFSAGWESAQGQHEQILLRLEVRIASGFFTAVQENTYLVPELRKRAEFNGSHGAAGHIHIISHPDINSN